MRFAAGQPAGAPRSASDVIPVGPAIATWSATWLLGMLLVAPAVLLALGADGDDYTIPQLALATGLAWLVFVIGLVLVSRRYAHDGIASWRQFVDHFGLALRPIDALGVPLGVALQFVLVPLLYVPLRHFWPDTFSTAELEERAQDLADKAGGGATVLLVLVVVVGAPIIEELVYRGLLQRSLSARLGGVGALMLVSAWFMVVHPSPVEYPGLLLAGLTFGACLVVTGRLGASIVTHAAFNAAALFVALR